MSTTEERRLEQTDAVEHAIRGDWQAAIAANEAILQAAPNDVEAMNRLAKAYFEIGTQNGDPNDTGANIAKAAELYKQVLSISPANTIAQRMITLLDRTKAGTAKQRKFIDMRNFAIDTGTSTITTIHVDVTGSLDLVPGEIVELRVVNTDPESESPSIPDDASAIDVYDSNGLLLGRIEPRLAMRIIRFMRNKNVYEAAVWRFSDHQQHIEIIIREVYAHPDNRNEVSFPGKLVEENERRMIVDDVEEDDTADDIEEDDTVEDTDSDYSNNDDDDEHERLDSIEANTDKDEEDEN